MKKIIRDAFSYVEYKGKTAPQERCSTCFYGTFPGSKCSLYEAINGLMPEAWNLEDTVNPNGACNAFTDKEVTKAVIRRDPIFVLKAGGEGSRGGKVIGHTSSGKPIYGDSHLRGTREWSERDHFEAYHVHGKADRPGSSLEDARLHSAARSYHLSEGSKVGGIKNDGPHKRHPWFTSSGQRKRFMSRS